MTHKTLVTLVFDDSDHAHDVVKALGEGQLTVIRGVMDEDNTVVKAEVAMPYKGWTY